MIPDLDIPAHSPAYLPSFTTDFCIFWHGSASGDLRGGRTGLHLGTYQAAKQALEAHISVPSNGRMGRHASVRTSNSRNIVHTCH